ncbi:serine hydrolase [Paracoccus onubensis]|uniref:beta-lactamase n=1 Tax=Paracoccus onubensis TaxID=1675788 RepID=A0A418ST87_9RHOB|nr:serine hydrolase [Paracoccus onubensis]RJE84170.1 serine hydrolase [Paracoccus onubensis]
MNKSSCLESLIARTPDIRWSIELRDIPTNTTAFSLGATRVLKTASLAKVFLLIEVAARLSEGTLTADEPIDRRDVPKVQDSGLWRYLKTDILPLADAATLVAAVSDNWATNALLHRVGLDAVRARSNVLGYSESLLADYIRDDRGPAHPPTVSEGRASDWTDLFARMHRRNLVSRDVDAQVEYWLGTGTDHSMIASALNLDPLIHGSAYGAESFYNKTGSDSGVRADAGLFVGENACSYCLIANWNPEADRADAVTEIMRAAGSLLRTLVTGRNAGL